MTNILLTGGMIAVFAVVFPIKLLTDLTNIGTLFAFVVVSVGIVVLRKTPNLRRGFKVPLVPLNPMLAVLFCGYLIFQLPPTTFP